MTSTTPRRHAFALAAALATSFVAARPALADARAEAFAKGALKKAATKYLNMDYAGAATLLDRAARTCGPKRCTPKTKAAVLRDLGTMQFRKGDTAAASKSFADAVALQPDIDLNPDYDTPDLRAAWNAAKGGGGGGGGGGAVAGSGEEPTGDFTHVPAAEQRANTPLPVYVEYTGDQKIARVILKYKSDRMTDWARMDLKRMGNGWGGLIPCGDVTTGTMRYWLQGFDAGEEPLVSSGDPKHPYTVPIRDEISSEPPHLPDRPPPRACNDEDQGDREERRHRRREGEGDEGGGGDNGGGGDMAADQGDTSSDARRSRRAPAFARLWVGLAGSVDFLSFPSGNDVCKLIPPGQPNPGQPANSNNFYCVNPDGSDFPSRANPLQNSQLLPGQSGTATGGFLAGNVRAMLTVDYALTPEILVGGRFGYVMNAYPGSAAVAAGRAFGAKFHLEARATYLFGPKPLTRPGFAPMAFGALGVSEFDGHVTTIARLTNDVAQPVDVWLTDGPFFLAVGGGVRYQFSLRAAFTAALRANLVIGGNGTLPTIGPEVGVQYGF